MAKPNNGTLKWVSVGVSILILAGGIFAAFIRNDEKIKSVDKNVAELKKSVAENVEELKTEGTLPARKNTTDIAVIKGELEAIRTEQRAGFNEILRRLPDSE